MTASNAPIPYLQSSSTIENERRAHQPSMEEILASIRKIIADDEAFPLSRPNGAPTESDFEAIVQPNEHFATHDAAAYTDLQSSSSGGNGWSADEPHAINAETGATAPRITQKPFAPFAPAHAPATPSDAAPRKYSQDLSKPKEGASSAASGYMMRGREDTAAHTVSPEDPALSADAVAFAEVEASLAAINAMQVEKSFPDPTQNFQYSLNEKPVPDLYSAANVEHQDSTPALYVGDTAASDSGILSTEANASVASSFQALSASVLMSNSDMIEGAVRDMLRPMLKQWLDDNLPVMVERMVRSEIERVARGGR